MLPLIVAALAATASPATPPTPPEVSPATVQSTPPSTPAARRDQVVCKAVIWQGIGAAQRLCATRAQWEARSAEDRQNLARIQLRSFSAAR